MSLSHLNPLQHEAVISEDRRLLVLAGAGSGKTKTLLQKIIYLIDEKGVSPSEILAITFTKNAANEMLDRLIESADKTGAFKAIISDKYKKPEEKDRARYQYSKQFKWIDGLTIRTFHSFCYSVLRNYGVKEFDNKFRLIGDDKPNDEDDQMSRHLAPVTAFEAFHTLLIELCSNTDYLLRLKRYLLDYMVDKIHLRKSDKPALQYDNKWYTCLDGTRVRSKSEQYIADWFYRHSIRYEYEPLLNVRDFEFHPDFYVADANLYIEHVSDKSYNTRQKEEQFRQGNLLLVKTYEAMTTDSALFNHVLESIVMGRLPANYQSGLRIGFMEAFNGHHDHVKEFVRMVLRVTDMVKVEDTDIKSIEQKAAQDQHERVREFYALALPLINAYKEFCVNKSYLDFNDLIGRCISLLQNHQDIAEKFRNSYQYILVDEFQDVNNLQVRMLELLLKQDTQLFCVGDDWQSIYGFRGSNVAYIVDFEKHFPGARLIKLNMNYRSTENIVGASNEVIKHNKFRIDKDVMAAKRSDHKIVIYAGQTEEEQLEFAVREVRQFLEAGGIPDDLLFLYRRSKMYQPFYHRFRQEGWRIPGKTIHAAKGLEAKVVFIIGLTEGNGGFPDVWLEDRIFQTIKEANFDLLMEEERRLFYVAITRAKDKLYLLTIKGNESGFLKEIPADYTVKTSASIAPVVEEVLLCSHCNSQLEKLFKVCPYCGTPVTLFK